MRYGSVCSGIEAATAAWHHMGWEPAFFSEIEAFPRAVLEHHYPDVPLHGDFTTIEKNQYGKIDLLVGGTPCQSFSVAGLRGGLDDERGNLALEFCRLAQREQPRWIVWENVPGVLSSNGGRDFGSILGALEDLGYGLAYRVLDAQYFGVAQRRRRVFVVGYLGDWRPAAAVLFERHSMSGHPAPSREARKETARSALSGAEERGGRGWERPYLTNTEACVTYSIMPMNSGKDYKARETEIAQPIMAGGPVGGNQGGDYIVQAYDILGVPATQGAKTTDVHVPLRARAPGQSEASTTTVILQQEEAAEAVTFAQNTRDEVRLIGGDGQISGALAAQPETKQTTYLAIGFNGDQSEKTRSMGEKEEQSPTLRAGSTCHVAIGFDAYNNDVTGDVSKTLDVGQDYHHVPIAFGWQNSASQGDSVSEDVTPTLDKSKTPALMLQRSQTQAVSYQSAVRRLTPVECERLQGFPDNFTAIPWKKKGPEQCPDGPRYKALGNSMAVPVMRWIGERIQLVEDLISVL